MEGGKLNVSSSIPLRKRSREAVKEDEFNNKNALDSDAVPEAKRICCVPAKDLDLMALLDRIDKMDKYTDAERVVKLPVEEEVSLKGLSNSNGDVENEFNYTVLLNELHMNYFDFCDEDLIMAVYSANNYGLLHDYAEVPMSIWEDDFWQVKDS